MARKVDHGILEGLESFIVKCKVVVFLGTLPKRSNSSHLKMDVWKMKLSFGMASWQVRTVSVREGNPVES